uniref:Uncharacterized protein n=1 Tax=Lygus hesperus TaxID=30085 RepID=A0A0A9XK54_LYGHE
MASTLCVIANMIVTTSVNFCTTSRVNSIHFITTINQITRHVEPLSKCMVHINIATSLNVVLQNSTITTIFTNTSFITDISIFIVDDDPVTGVFVCTHCTSTRQACSTVFSIHPHGWVVKFAIYVTCAANAIASGPVPR